MSNQVIAIFFFFTMQLIAKGNSLCVIQNDSIAEGYFNLGNDFKKKSQPDSAVIYYEKASKEFQKAGLVEKFVDSYNQIGIVLTRQDKYEMARTYLDKALSTGLASLDSNNLIVATTYISLGVVCSAESLYSQSLEYHYKALSIRLSKLGEYDSQVATSYGNIGNVYLSNKEYEKSIDAHLKAMEIREEIFGKNGIEVVQSYSNLGKAYKEKGDYNKSLKFFEMALNSKILQLGSGHKDLSKYYASISDVYYLMQDKMQGDFYKMKADEVLKN